MIHRCGYCFGFWPPWPTIVWVENLDQPQAFHELGLGYCSVSWVQVLELTPQIPNNTTKEEHQILFWKLSLVFDYYRLEYYVNLSDQFFINYLVLIAYFWWFPYLHDTGKWMEELRVLGQKAHHSDRRMTAIWFSAILWSITLKTLDFVLKILYAANFVESIFAGILEACKNA